MEAPPSAFGVIGPFGGAAVGPFGPDSAGSPVITHGRLPEVFPPRSAPWRNSGAPEEPRAVTPWAKTLGVQREHPHHRATRGQTYLGAVGR